ncbi:MAG: D-alanyl-D-alanine carboxypeptidase/D-alanyl-D-alanine-endopeptidase [Candidatus Acidiferrales bacterium]
MDWRRQQPHWILTLLVCAGVLQAAAAPAQKKQKKSRNAPASVTNTRPDLDRFTARVTTALDEAHARKADWGILVTDADTGETLYERNADEFFTPASNAKLFTTAFALAALGPDYRFRTTIETSSAVDDDGRLHGDLVLVGRGDPDLSNRVFPFAQKAERDGPAEKVIAELADAVVAKGVKQIDGNIVADDSYFPYDPYPEGWTVGDLYFGFGAPISAIALDDNTLTITAQPGVRLDDPALITVEPWAGYETFGHEITTGPSASKPQFSVVREPGPKPIFLRGTIPLGGAPVKIDIALEEPAEYTADLLKRLLEARGVRIAGDARAQHGPPPEREADATTAIVPVVTRPPTGTDAPVVLAEHISLPLIESIRLLNKTSQNLHAELILRTVAREKAGVGTTDAGVEIERNFLESIGIAPGDTSLVDGSGLSRQNLVTPRATLQLLAYAERQPWAQSFLSTLPIAGQDGTLEDRMKNTPAAGRVHAKTGSLEHVRAITGYATTVPGAHLNFSIFTNNNPQLPRDAATVFDSIILAMVEEIHPQPAHK